MSLGHLIATKVTLQDYFLTVREDVSGGRMLIDVFEAELTDFEGEKTEIISVMFYVKFN